MRKLSMIVQWVVVLAILGFVGYVVFRRSPQPEYQPERWQSWEGITVLSYAGIARSDELWYPSVKRLEEHLTALRDAGYQTVRPADVRAFLGGGAPLPEKALLLIFEGGRKDAFIRATPVLQRTGFMAVIAVPTEVTDVWGGFFLNRRDLARITRIPQWTVGSMGHHAYSEIPVDATGTTGRFLVSRMWKGEEAEDPTAFQERVLGDYATSSQLIEDATGRSPMLYLYPYGEAGQTSTGYAMAEAINRAGVTQHYSLAFVGAHDPFNGPERDPWALSRLRVPGDWPAERLLTELSLSRRRIRMMESLGKEEDWLFERGAAFQPDAMELPAGAAAWLRGTDGWSDIEISAEIAVGGEGVGSLYARHTGPRSWVRVSLSGDGLRVQESLGGGLQTLFHKPWSEMPEESGMLRLRLRNNRAWVWMDDVEVASNLPLSTVTRRGRVGFGSEGDALRVLAFHAQPLFARLLLANSIRVVPEDQRALVQSVLPVWFRADEPPQLAETQRQDLLRSAVSGIETIPMISGTADMDDGAAASLALAVDEALRQGGAGALVRALAVEGPADTLAAELRERGYRVVHVLDPAQAARAGSTIARVSSNDWLLINASGPEADHAKHIVLHDLSPNRLAVVEEDAKGFGPEIRTALMAHQRTWEEE